MDFFSLFRRPNKSRKSGKKSTGSLAKNRMARPDFELLEDRMMLSASTISGYVYHDSNHNGLFDLGETPIVNANLELHNSLGQVIATAISDANGFYQFTNDSTINTNPVTMDQTVTIPATLAGFTLSKQVNQFDPSLGQLLEVDIIHDGSITSDIKAENTSTLVGSNITGVVSGQMMLTGPGFSITSTVSQNAGSFLASVFDGVIDFAGTSGKDFGASTATASTKTVVLSGAQLNAFIGTGQLNFTEEVDVNSTATGGGNLVANITSTATATFTVRYKYIPSNALKPGNYTIVETQQPSLPSGPGKYLDGLESHQGTVIPNTIGTDVIPVTLTSNNSSPNNNFGELVPASLAGNVYYDSNNNGFFDPGEQAIGGVTVALTGTDDAGHLVSLSTSTLADGSYSFTGLRPGTYTLTETQPANYLDGKDTVGSLGGTVSNDQFSNISVGDSAAGINYNFGEVKNSSLAGFVYNDVNNNGVKEVGESGISGVAVTLTGSDDLGPVSRIVLTGADGSYLFDNLRAGTYTITETQPQAYLDGKDTIGTPGGNTTNDKFSNIVLPFGTAGTNNNFGEMQAASLAGFVYNDVNNDGFKQVGESGIAGVSVTLTGVDDLGLVSRTAITGADGSYLFNNLRAGTYTITETQPAAYLDGKDTIGTPGGNTANDQFSNIVLPFGTAGANNNFGELQAASLAGFVYNDVNNNGIKELGEQGIAGVSVTLTGMDDLGPVSRTVTTGPGGSYLFNNLRAGTYTITEAQPSAYFDGKDTIGTPGGNTTNDQFSNIALPFGTAGANNNFGELLPASLAGFVYDDANNNGIMDGGEQGIAGATLTLTGTDDNGQFVTRTALTAADGSYLFNNLRPGAYAIQETQPNGYLDGKDLVGTPGGLLSNDRISGINLSQGTAGANNDFGELLPASLAGFVYDDVNNNGVKDSGELGIAGVTVTLTGADDLGPVSRITQTAADGSYKFDNLRPGIYSIQESQPTLYQDGKDAIGSLGGITGNDFFTNVAPQQSQHGTDYDFGEINPTGVSGMAWHDANDNGIMDNGETGIGGVAIKLTGTTAGGSPVTMQTTTAADGSYNFANLQPGTYTIQETQPAGWMDGKDSLGTSGGTMTNDKFANISLQEGILGIQYNFGELMPGSITGHVWQDDNNDGIMNPGENGIANVKVTLTGTDDTGAAVTKTTTTAADGSYQFANLRPGTYSLQETQPTGWIDGMDALGSLGGIMTNDHFGNVVVGDSQNGTDYDFGERKATDVGVTKKVTPTTAQPGATLKYTLVITNYGPTDAMNVQVDDELPAGEIFVTAKATGWTLTVTNGHVIFTRSSLAVGTSSTITITAVAPLTPGTYTNTVVVSTTSFDTNPLNNQAKAKVKVVKTPTSVSPPPGSCPPNSVVVSSDQSWLDQLKKNLGK